MLVLWLATGVLANGDTVAPEPAQPVGGVIGNRAYYRRYDAFEIEQKLERVIEATRRPKSRRARKNTHERISKSLKELLSSVDVSAPDLPLSIRDLPRIAELQNTKQHAEWIAILRIVADQALIEMQALRELQDEQDIEELLMMVH